MFFLYNESLHKNLKHTNILITAVNYNGYFFPFSTDFFLLQFYPPYIINGIVHFSYGTVIKQDGVLLLRYYQITNILQLTPEKEIHF